MRPWRQAIGARLTLALLVGTVTVVTATSASATATGDGEVPTPYGGATELSPSPSGTPVADLEIARKPRCSVVHRQRHLQHRWHRPNDHQERLTG